MIQEVPCVEAEPPEPQEPSEQSSRAEGTTPTPEEAVSSAHVPQAHPQEAPEEAQEEEAHEAQEEEEAPPAPKPKRAPKAKAAPKTTAKTKAAPKPKVQKKPLPTIPQEPVNPFASFSNTDLIAEILVRTDGQRQEQKRQLLMQRREPHLRVAYWS